MLAFLRRIKAAVIDFFWRFPVDVRPEPTKQGGEHPYQWKSISEVEFFRFPTTPTMCGIIDWSFSSFLHAASEDTQRGAHTGDPIPSGFLFSRRCYPARKETILLFASRTVGQAWQGRDRNLYNPWYGIHSDEVQKYVPWETSQEADLGLVALAFAEGPCRTCKYRFPAALDSRFCRGRSYAPREKGCYETGV